MLDRSRRRSSSAEKRLLMDQFPLEERKRYGFETAAEAAAARWRINHLALKVIGRFNTHISDPAASGRLPK